MPYGTFSRGKMIKDFYDEDQLIILVDGQRLPQIQKAEQNNNVGLNITKLVVGHANVEATIMADSHDV